MPIIAPCNGIVHAARAIFSPLVFTVTRLVGKRASAGQSDGGILQTLPKISDL